MKKVELKFYKGNMEINNLADTSVPMQTIKSDVVTDSQINLVYASECFPKYTVEESELLSIMHSWNIESNTGKYWINLLSIIFYRYIGRQDFTYTLYIPDENLMKGKCFNVNIPEEISNRAISELIAQPISVDKCVVDTNPEIAVVFMSSFKEDEINVQYAESCPDILIIFGIDENNKVTTKIYYKNKYSKQSIQSIIDGIGTLIKEHEEEANVYVNNIELDNLSINQVVHKNTGKSIIQAMDENAEKFPDKVAFEDEDKMVTNIELFNEVNQMCNYLDDMGMSSSNIAIMGDRTLEQIIVILAIIKSKRVYVPIDSSISLKKFQQITKKLNIETIVISQAQNVEIAQNIDYIDLKDMVNKANKYSVEYKNKNTITDIICVLQTSGTSGQAKIHQHNQIPILHVIEAHNKECNYSDDDVIAQRSPLQHIPSLPEFCLGIINNIKTVIISDTILLDPAKFNEFVNVKKITWIQLVPSLMEYYFIKNQFTYKNLKYIVPLGEELKVELLYDFMEKYSNIRVINNYGMTECNTIMLGTVSYKYMYNKVPLGQAIDNYLVAIVNEEGAVVPKGIMGQIVMTYYYERENVLEERAGEKGYIEILGFNENMLVTGDYGNYISETDFVEYRGRRDSMCKIKGKRVELLEVEEAICNYEDIKQCKVIVDKLGGRDQMVAFVVFEENKGVVIDLRKFLASNLEEYLIPEQIIVLDELPLTKTKKINIAKLREDFNHKQAQEDDRVARAFKTILNCDIDEDTVFSELGISSFQTIEIAEILSKEYNIKINVIELYNYPTMSALKEYIADITKQK